MFFARAKKISSPLPLLAFFFLAVVRLTAAPTGPTLQFDYGQGQPQTNAVSKFMYFVPLISPDPVSVFTNTGNTQCARVLSFACQTNGATFVATCEFDFTGSGFQQNIFDLTEKIKRRQKELQNGGIIKHALAAINVTGTGSGNVEIVGVITNGVRQVNQVRLRFNSHGHTSPVTINMKDLCYIKGAVQSENEMVARVNMLTFKRNPGPPKMEVSLGSIKRADASDGLWQNFLGGLKGVTANFFLPPLNIEPEGQQTMLDFGLALASKKSDFSFPEATRLKVSAPAKP
jgi:hypothetical protein